MHHSQSISTALGRQTHQYVPTVDNMMKRYYTICYNAQCTKKHRTQWGKRLGASHGTSQSCYPHPKCYKHCSSSLQKHNISTLHSEISQHLQRHNHPDHTHPEPTYAYAYATFPPPLSLSLFQHHECTEDHYVILQAVATAWDNR